MAEAERTDKKGSRLTWLVKHAVRRRSGATAIVPVSVPESHALGQRLTDPLQPVGIALVSSACVIRVGTAMTM